MPFCAFIIHSHFPSKKEENKLKIELELEKVPIKKNNKVSKINKKKSRKINFSEILWFWKRIQWKSDSNKEVFLNKEKIFQAKKKIEKKVS